MKVIRSITFGVQTRCASDSGRRWRSSLLALCVLALFAPLNGVWAGLRLCNKSSDVASVALGYRDNDVWVTEGWWNIPGRSCEILVRSNLKARYFYLYGVDKYGSIWAGSSVMCIDRSKFTIRGIKNCLERGYDQAGFIEIDTKEQQNWTVEFSDEDKNNEQNEAGN